MAGEKNEAWVEEALPAHSRLDSGRYQILNFLGRGGFAITYAAVDHNYPDGPPVAIKESFPAHLATREGTTVSVKRKGLKTAYRDGLTTFLNEGHMLAEIEHPNVVKAYEYFKDNGTAYLVLQYLSGQTFETVFEQLPRRPSFLQLNHLLHPLLNALEAIHRKNMLHRDISPDNIFIREDGDPVLFDFGAAKNGSARKDQESIGVDVVKDGYSPIEQYTDLKNQGEWTDIYALSASFYWAITGKVPPSAETRSEAISNGLPDPIIKLAKHSYSEYPKKFLAALVAGLEIVPNNRPQNIGKFRALFPEPNPEKILPTPVPIPEPSKPTIPKVVSRPKLKNLTRRRFTDVSLLMGIAFAALILAALVFLVRPPSTSSEDSWHSNAVNAKKDGKFSEALTIYESECKDKGTKEACNLAGMAYQDGKIGYENLNEARLYFDMACKKSLRDGCNNLIPMLVEGLGGDKDLSRAQNLAIEACDVGNLRHCVTAGDLLTDGKGPQDDLAEGGNSYAKNCLATHDSKTCRLTNNVGVRIHKKKKYDSAFSIFLKACNNGNGDFYGCRNVAVYHEVGYIKEDIPKAIIFYGMACKMGHAEACSEKSKLEQ